MAAKGTDNHVAENVASTATVVEEVKVPHQADKPKLEVLEGETEESFSAKLKRIASNKKFVAGVSSVALIAAGVFVVRKRNESVIEDETVTD